MEPQTQDGFCRLLVGKCHISARTTTRFQAPTESLAVPASGWKKPGPCCTFAAGLGFATSGQLTSVSSNRC